MVYVFNPSTQEQRQEDCCLSPAWSTELDIQYPAQKNPVSKTLHIYVCIYISVYACTYVCIYIETYINILTLKSMSPYIVTVIAPN